MSGDGEEGARGRAFGRRGGEERRQAGGARPGKEQRSGVERRLLVHGVIHPTAGLINELEDWLRDNCRGRWNLELIEADAAFLVKTMGVMFEDADDKAKFEAAFGG